MKPSRPSNANNFLQALSPALRPVLRCADKHFNQIVVQAVIELALKTPFKLGMIEVPRVQVEVIGMHRD
jgi:hypothetical protein